MTNKQAKKMKEEIVNYSFNQDDRTFAPVKTVRFLKNGEIRVINLYTEEDDEQSGILEVEHGFIVLDYFSKGQAKNISIDPEFVFAFHLELL